LIRWLLLDTVLSLLATIVASYVVPVTRPKGRRLAVLLFALLCLVLPFVGAVLTLVYAVALRSVVHRTGEAEVEPIRLPPPARDFRLRPINLTPGAIAPRMRGSRDPQQRVEALSQVMGSRFADEIRLLRSALRDEAEEVRLLAYAALDRREQENTDMLIDLQRRIAGSADEALVGRFQEYLAWLRWNIDHSVSQETAEPVVRLDDVRGPVSTVGAQTSAAEPPFLQGLRALEHGEANLALAHFASARGQGIAAAVLAPHEAAAHFLLRDLGALRELYRKHPELSVSPRYGPSHRFWQGAERG